MKIETDAQQINSLLSENSYGECLVWMYDVSLRRMMLRLSLANDSQATEPYVLYILAVGCRHFCGPLDLEEPAFSLAHTISEDGDSTYTLKDEANRFELKSNGGIIAYYGKATEIADFLKADRSSPDDYSL